MKRTRLLATAFVLGAVACGGSDASTDTGGDTTTGTGGTAAATGGTSAGGKSGSGTGGVAGKATGGTSAGTAGQSTGGTAGANGGTGGASAGGTGGAAGGSTGGTGGSAGKAGSGGGGTGGTTAGSAGTAGAAGGSAGSSGAGGSAGKAGGGGGGASGSSGASGSGGSGGSPIVTDCKMTSDCAMNPTTKLCDTMAGKCVGCLAAPMDTCPANQYCSEPGGQCASGCKGDTDCKAPTPHCDLASHSCKQCTTDPECPAGNICAPGGTCAPGCSMAQACVDAAQTCCGTSCHDTSNGDIQNCGGCNMPCKPFANAATLCTGKACTMGACAMGFADCNGNPADGCEVNTATQGACVCKPGATQACYYGPMGTLNVGVCKGGLQTCAADGLSFGLDCVGQQLPQKETCTDGLDHDCDGAVNNVPDVDGDGWTVCQGDCCEDTTQCGSPKLVNPGAVDVIGSAFPDADCDGVIDPAGFQLSGLACASAATKVANVSATDMAAAMELCRPTTASPPQAQKIWGIISAQQLLADGTAPSAAQLTSIQKNQVAVLTKYGTAAGNDALGQPALISPRKGSTMVGMSTGTMRYPGLPAYIPPNPGTYQDNQPYAPGPPPVNNGFLTSAASPPAAFLAAHGNALPPAAKCGGGMCPTGTGANDSVNLRLKLRTPTNANSFSYDFRFFSAEYAHWQCSLYNDFFVTQLLTTAAGIPADKNISFDTNKNPVSVNNGFFEVCNVKGCNTCPNGPIPLTGTGMDMDDPYFFTTMGTHVETGGGTVWLTTNAPITPGEIMTLDLTIFDVNDHALDSVVLVDNFNWSAASIGGPSTGHSPLVGAAALPRSSSSPLE